MLRRRIMTDCTGRSVPYTPLHVFWLLQVALGLGTAFVWACIVVLLVGRHKVGQLFTSDVEVLHLVALTIPAMSLSLLCECRTSASCMLPAHWGRTATAPNWPTYACRMWAVALACTQKLVLHTAVLQNTAAALGSQAGSSLDAPACVRGPLCMDRV
jgi:Na+-driven multidrug efflux pump